MTGEAIGFFGADGIRAGSVMTEDNMPQFPRQRTLDKVCREPLVIGYNIAQFPAGQMDRGYRVLRFAKGADDLIPVLTHAQRHFGEWEK